MASKNIKIDTEAYQRLCSVRRQGESFSQVIKRVVRRPFDVEAFLNGIRECAMSDEAIADVEEQIEHRHEPSRREY